jgi:hypothetical protein
MSVSPPLCSLGRVPLEFIAVATARREIDDAVYRVLLKYELKGWGLRRQGHKFYFYCPCKSNSVRIDGTPRNPQQQAKRIEREISHCPELHDLDR